MTVWSIYRVASGPLWGTSLRKLGTVEAPTSTDAARQAQQKWPDEKSISIKVQK